MKFPNPFKKKPVVEEKQSFDSILLGYQLILDRINHPKIVSDPGMIVASLISCGLDKNLTNSALLGLGVSVLALKREINIMGKMMLDAMDYAAERNSETAGFITTKLKDLMDSESQIAKEAEVEAIKYMKTLMR